MDSELDLFDAAVRYAKALDKRTTERSVSPPAEVVEPEKSPAPSTSKDQVCKKISVCTTCIGPWF